ncbi:MAG TPA: hypothetical protein VM388_09805 [Acidimicrobiales bacterium]|nr:hypothetical protein [Acidimicrobiales bacterium]
MATVGGLMGVPSHVLPRLHRTERVPAPRLLVVLVLLAGVLFLGYGSQTIAAPFGDSHDGRNAGVWVAAGRAIRESGPLASRLGTRTPENGVYANHPPLIAVEVALVEAVAGRSNAASRAPAWVGSLVAIGLLAVLLSERGMPPGAAGAAVALVVATPMFLVFGTMLDTPVTSLPFGIGVLVLWERARRGRRVHPALAAGLAALAALAGWQSLLVAGLVAAWAGVRVLRRRRPVGAEAGFVAGALAGAGLLTAWLWWGLGGTLRPLTEAYTVRTGDGPENVALGRLAATLVHDGRAMFGVVLLLGLLGLVPALARRSTRGLTAVALAATVPYPLVFRTGAVNHEYWNYWFVLPLAIGLAAGAAWVVDIVGRGAAGPAVAATAGVLATAMAVGAWVRPTPAAWALREGVRAGAAAEAATLGAGQKAGWYAGAVGRPAAWVGLAERRPALPVSPDDAGRLAAERPGDTVLVGRVRCLATGAPHVDYSLESLADLLARPPEIALCRTSPQPSRGVGR